MACTMSPHDPQKQASPKHPWLWFVGLWFAGFLTVGSVAYIIKFLMGLVG